MAQFAVGQPRPPNGGRKPGTPNRNTALMRAGLKSAIDTLLAGDGEDPIKAAFKIARFIEGMTAKRLEKWKEQIADMPPGEYTLVMNGLTAAADLHLRLAEFVFPKQARVEHIGDPMAPTVENKVVVMLQIGDEQPRPFVNGREELPELSEDDGGPVPSNGTG